jgi:hypothetical protein
LAAGLKALTFFCNGTLNVIKLRGFFAGKLIVIEIEKNITPLGSIPIPIAISIPIKTT